MPAVINKLKMENADNTISLVGGILFSVIAGILSSNGFDFMNIDWFYLGVKLFFVAISGLVGAFMGMLGKHLFYRYVQPKKRGK